MRNHKEENKTEKHSNGDVREAAPNAELFKTINELFNLGQGKDIILCLSQMYTCAQMSDEANKWTTGDRVDVANIYAGLTKCVIKLEKYVTS